MVKIIGMILIVLSGTMIGFVNAAYFINRPKYIELIIKSICFIDTNIKFKSQSFKEILQELTRNPEYKKLSFYRDCYISLTKGESLDEAWNNSLENFKAKKVVSNEDIENLLGFGKNLGCTDVEGQNSNCKLYVEIFKNQKASAEDDKKKKGNMYQTLGILGGIGISILLI